MEGCSVAVVAAVYVCAGLDEELDAREARFRGRCVYERRETIWVSSFYVGSVLQQEVKDAGMARSCCCEQRLGSFPHTWDLASCAVLEEQLGGFQVASSRSPVQRGAAEIVEVVDRGRGDLELVVELCADDVEDAFVDAGKLALVEAAFVLREELEVGLFGFGDAGFAAIEEDGVPGVVVRAEARTRWDRVLGKC